MVFKSIEYEPARPVNYDKPPRPITNRPREEGHIIALVGTPQQGRPSRNPLEEHLERIYQVDSDLLGYNLDGRMALLRLPQNDRSFDQYIALPFMKGVTERKTGRTLLIVGSDAHHGEAMQGQFDGVIWKPDDGKQFGDTIRWINVGDMQNGFIGLDYNPAAKQCDGVATCLENVKFLATTLLHAGYDHQKRLFLLKPPYIVEQDIGKRLRKQGLETLTDYSTKPMPKV